MKGKKNDEITKVLDEINTKLGILLFASYAKVLEMTMDTTNKKRLT